MPDRPTDGDETAIAEEVPKDPDRTEVAAEGPEDPDATEVTSEDDQGSKPEAPSSPPDRRFEPGAVLADRYRVISRLGKGGMGEVFLADDLKLDQQVALKFLPPEAETDKRLLQLLFDEIKVARQISHPNCCRVFDLGEADGVHFLSMEYIDGEDLSSLLGRIGRLPWEKAVELGSQACEGLAAAHDAGILHRDLKPANLMIDGQGRAKITDFGLAALSESVSGAAIRSGTPAYMAPEQLSGTEVSVQSDIYALGLLLYELFTGRRVFQASSLAEMMKLHREAKPKPPSAWVESIDPAIERVLLQCLEKDPKARPASAREVATALEEGEGAAEGARIATLLLSDLVGSTGLVERSGDATSAELFEKHDRLARDLLEQHGGREIDKTDGFLLLFDRPWQAVRYALDYHRALAELSQSAGVEVESRIGIHLGEIVLRRNPPKDVARGAKPFEVEGLAKPTAARLMSVAGGRQTLMTQAAFDLARRSAVGSSEEAGSLQWLAHGGYEFKGVEEPVEVFEVGAAGFAPLAAPESSEKAKRVADEDTILGWRPAPGLEIPHRPNWELIEKLGEGGFGEVWLGKYKKTGEQRVFKFCYEAERLLSLQREITVFRLLKEELGQRDDIARILDWNLEEAPYFIEFVHIPGGNLVDWSVSQGGIAELPMTDRLELIAQVATALAASHSVGVLHKDVKPANVLIEIDAPGTPEAKPKAVLTDFGIGLVTDAERLAAKGITMMGMTEMEAATGDSAATGTQIYMAPELLAGQPSTIQADIFALGVMLYQVVVGDLERPLAQGWNRHVGDELLRDDIAALIDGSPTRRPGSAAEVAEKLRALEERRAAREAEEQAARAAERAQRRRKILTTVAAVSSVFLVVVSFLLVQTIRARADSERRRGQAEQLIDFMLNDLHEGLDKIGRLDLLGGVAQSSKEYFDSLTERDESPDALNKRGVTLQNIGDVLLDQGDAESALAAQESAVSLFQDAVANEPANERWQLGLGLSRLRLGKTRAAWGDTDAALEAYRQALPQLEQLAAGDREDPGPRLALAQAHYLTAALENQIGDMEDAARAAESAVRILEELTRSGSAHWRHSLLLIDSLRMLGNIHRFENKLEEALDEVTRARNLAIRLALEDPANTYWPRRLAVVQELSGSLLYLTGDPKAALASFEAAGRGYRELVKTDPTRVEWRERLTVNDRLTGFTHLEAGNSRAAIELFRESQAVLEGLVAEDPTRVGWLSQLAASHQLIGDLQLTAGELDDAEASVVAAIELRKRIIAASGDDPRPQNMLSWHRVRLGDVYQRGNDLERARAEWSHALELIEPVTSAAPEETMYLDTHAQALLRLGRLEESRPLVEKLLAGGWDDAEFLQLVRDSGLDLALPQ